MGKKLLSECYLEEKYGIDHSKFPEMALHQYYFVGALFPHRRICAACVNKLKDAARIADLELRTQQAYKDVEIELTDIKNWRGRNPEYAAAIDDFGWENLRFEITKQLFEIPFEPKEVEANLPMKTGDLDGETGRADKSKFEVKVE
jgi:hypothetical protein